MFTRLAASALAIALMAAPVAAHELHTGAGPAHSHVKDRAHSHPDAEVVQKTIRINCYRGPIRETVWDHPRGVFVDDLVAFGYDYSEAHGIAMRICRDVTAVGKPGAMRDNLLRAIAQTPPGH